MENLAAPLLSEKQNSLTKLFCISPAEALKRRAEFEPQIREVYDGYHGPERTYMRGPTRRRIPGSSYSYRDSDNFIVYRHYFDNVVAIFYNIILAYLSYNDNDIMYLSEFYAWAYWCDTGSTELPQAIYARLKDAILLCEKNATERRQKKEAENAEQREQAKQLNMKLFNRYFYADDVKAGKTPYDADRMADCLAFKEIVTDVKELVLADYFVLYSFMRLSTSKPRILMQCTLLKAAQFEKDGKLSFTNAWDENGKFDLDAFVEGELDREGLKVEAEKARRSNQGRTIPEQFARKQFDCLCRGEREPSYCTIQGKQVEWIENTKKVQTPLGEIEAGDTEHLIQWGEQQYKRQDFFAAAYPEQYNQVKRRVKFAGKYEDDASRLTTGQRTKLMYNILAYKYRDYLVPVDEADENALKVLCSEETNNPTASDLLSRLNWTDGLSKLVTFGVGMKMGGAAQNSWCYTVDFEVKAAKYRGAEMTWEQWSCKLITILDNYEKLSVLNKSEDLETVFRRALYY